MTYKPSNDASDRAFAKDRAKQIAQEWSRAMRKDCVSDFIAVGDVSIKAIGADNQILDSNVPVRQMLEEIVAKMGIPPFLLGLSWSSTERMSSQQADILTSELEAYRRLLNPVDEKNLQAVDAAARDGAEVHHRVGYHHAPGCGGSCKRTPDECAGGAN